MARSLGFDDVCRNSLDAVSDRDFAIEFCAAAALIMTHISRLSEELVLWMSPRVGFIDLAVSRRTPWLITRDHALRRLARRARAFGVAVVTPEGWAAAQACRAPLPHPDPLP